MIWVISRDYVFNVISNSNIVANDKMSNVRMNTTQSSKTPQVVLPQPFLTLEEFFETWFSWKDNFLKYKSMDNNKEREWGTVLLNSMGPIGQDIFTKLTFKLLFEYENIDILLQKFDEYCIFQTKKRLPRENIYEYIADLQSITEQRNLENGKEIIKQKILMEIDEFEFTNAAKTFISVFKFSLDYKNLTLKETAFIWKSYIDNEHKGNCRNCGNQHVANVCPAINKQCAICKKQGHYHRRCPTRFIFDCKYCGSCHFNRRCPAFKETCTKCQKGNHFSWMCQLRKTLNCRYCGLNHPISRQYCPANNTYCSNCKQLGHFTSKCNRFQSKNK